MSAADLPLRETVAFVERALGAGPRRRVLEVGCGDGALAAALNARGRSVVGLDADADAVARARARGVDARVACFPEFDDAPFAAILFARSLHHLPDLDAVFARTRALLAPGGRVVVEDFAWNHVDRATAAWIDGLAATSAAAGRPFEGLATTPDPLVTWRVEHADLHTWESMLAAAQRAFAIERIESAPYAYRYVARALASDARGYEIAAAVLATEHALIAADAIVSLGRRLVMSA